MPTDLAGWLYFTAFAVFVMPMSAYLIAKLAAMGSRKGQEEYQRNRRKQNGN